MGYFENYLKIKNQNDNFFIMDKQKIKMLYKSLKEIIVFMMQKYSSWLKNILG